MYYGNDDATDQSSYYNTFHEDNNNIVLDMPMKYQLGTNVWDVSGHGNNGTLYNGPVWVSGGGLDFDGSNDYVEVPDDSSLTSTNNLTISVWWSSQEFSSSYTALIGKGTTDIDEEYTVLVRDIYALFDVGNAVGPWTYVSYTFPQIAIFKLELIEPADNPDIILEKGPFILPAIFYTKVTLDYTIPIS